MQTLIERTTSGFPLSISTALAFESLFTPRQTVYDPLRQIPERIDISKYKQLWINVDTLFRNMIQSASKEMLMNTGYKEASMILIDEMHIIENLLLVEGKNTTEPVFYRLDYEAALKSRHESIKLRTDNSANQLFLADLKRKTFELLLKNTKSVVEFKTEIKPKDKTSALMLTHYPFDLTFYKNFSVLDLLESNTGKLKTRRQWNTKYYPVPGYDMNILPFYRMLLLFLGDKALIQPVFLKFRKLIMDCAVKRQWTPLTTMDKCLLDLSIDLNPFDYAVIRTAIQ